MRKLWLTVIGMPLCFGILSLFHSFASLNTFVQKGIYTDDINSNVGKIQMYEANRTNGHSDLFLSNSDSKPETLKGLHETKKSYKISFYVTPWHIWSRIQGKSFPVFKHCQFKNCEVIQDSDNFTQSDAVIFKGRILPKTHPFPRPPGQVWIFYEEEIPLSYDRFEGHWRSETWKGAFNYTMTYDRQNTDIFFPYGGILQRHNRDVPKRDFLAIARSKTKDAVIITSHCNTRSKRMEFIKELRKYIDVDVFGTCGKPFKCGHQYTHDRCFDRINSTYRFYLAFENAFCRGYRTEKFYDNYNYDTIMVVRGDQKQFIEQDKAIKNTYISTSDFINVSELGRYLKHLSENPRVYAEILQRKTRYHSQFDMPYRQAMCKVCELLNDNVKYQQQIENLVTWALDKKVCYEPPDL